MKVSGYVFRVRRHTTLPVGIALAPSSRSYSRCARLA